MMGYPRNESFTFSNFQFQRSQLLVSTIKARVLLCSWQDLVSKCSQQLQPQCHLHCVFRDLDSALGTAHRVKGENRANARGKAVTDMLRDCWWPRLQIPLETIQVGRNCDFDADDSEMRMQAFALFAGPSNSKFTAEDVFAHLQHVGSRSNKGFNKMNKCPIVSLTFFPQ